ncbi:MAG: response regulator, partial [Planctomycetes bacterium]|nr:response regulator [Planctomycetota bacterium]
HTGLRDDEIAERHILEFIPIDQRANVTLALKTILEKEYIQMEVKLIGIAGSRPSFHVSSRVMKDEKGKVTGVSGVAKDMSYIRQSQEILREREQRYRSLVDHIGLGVCLLSIEKRVLSVNRKLREWFPEGDWNSLPLCSEALLCGMECPNNNTECPIDAVLRDGEIHEGRRDIIIGKRARTMRIVTYPVLNEKGKITGVVELMEDITERLETEKKLLEATEKADHASRTKSAFLANTSHEIRTPLSGIISVAELLEFTDLNPEQKRYVRILRDSGHSLLTIINDVLDISKIEAGKLVVVNEQFDLRTLLEELLNLFSARAEQRENILQLEMDNSLPAYLEGDPNRVRQIMVNIIGNAIKFTNRGKILIGLKGSVDGMRFIAEFTVKDTGIGIARERQREIFDEFVQAGLDTERKSGGTGLGLAIVKRLTELLGGSVHIESEIGAGSLFRIRLPFGVSDKTMVREIPANAKGVSYPNSKVLLVEDNEMCREVAKMMLEHLGVSVDTARDGIESVELFASRKYDLVFMDLRMPKLNGLQAITRIRKLEDGLPKRTPVIAMTAFAMRDDRQLCLQSGMEDFIPKPITMVALRQVLGRFLT